MVKINQVRMVGKWCLFRLNVWRHLWTKPFLDMLNFVIHEFRTNCNKYWIIAISISVHSLISYDMIFSSLTNVIYGPFIVKSLCFYNLQLWEITEVKFIHGNQTHSCSFDWNFLIRKHFWTLLTFSYFCLVQLIIKSFFVTFYYRVLISWL